METEQPVSVAAQPEWPRNWMAHSIVVFVLGLVPTAAAIWVIWYELELARDYPTWQGLAAFIIMLSVWWAIIPASVIDVFR